MQAGGVAAARAAPRRHRSARIRSWRTRGVPIDRRRRDAAGRRRDAAARARSPRRAERVLEPVEVAHDRRTDVRVHERRRRALELRRLRIHLVRERDRARRRDTRRGSSSRARRSCAGFRYECRNTIAIDVTPSVRSRCVAARTASSSSGVSTSPSAVTRSVISRRTRRARDRLGRGIRRIPDVFLVAAPELDLVAEARGDEQPGRRARHLDHRVVAGGGAVHDRCRRREQRVRVGVPAASASRPIPASTPSDWSCGRRRRLLEHERPVGRQQHAVGERAPDIRSRSCSPSRSLAPLLLARLVRGRAGRGRGCISRAVPVITTP